MNEQLAETLETEEMTLDEYHSAIRSQNVAPEDVTHQCPICGTLQSANDLIEAGAGKDYDEVRGILGFSCIGRFDKTKGCDWTLGGLLHLHNLEVLTPDGKKHPVFRPAPRAAMLKEASHAE